MDTSNNSHMQKDTEYFEHMIIHLLQKRQHQNIAINFLSLLKNSSLDSVAVAIEKNITQIETSLVIDFAKLLKRETSPVFLQLLGKLQPREKQDTMTIFLLQLFFELYHFKPAKNLLLQQLKAVFTRDELYFLRTVAARKLQPCEAIHQWPKIIIDSILPQIASSLTNANTQIRKETITLLATIAEQHESAIVYLMQALADRLPELRKLATFKLKDLGTAIIPYLKQALQSTKRRVLTSAIWLAGKLQQQALEIAPDIITVLQDDEKVKDVWQWALKKMDVEVAPILIANFSALSAPFAICCGLEVLGEIGTGHPQTPAFISSFTKHANSEVQIAALLALGQLKATEFAPAMIAVLDSEDPCICHAGIKALASLQTNITDAVEPLLDIVQRASDSQIRMDAVQALAHSCGNKTIGVFCQILKDEEEDVLKESIVKILSSWGKDSVKALPRLRKLIHSPNSSLQMTAIDAIGNLGAEAKSMLPDLLKMALKSNAQDARRIIQALGDIGQSAIPFLVKMAEKCSGELHKDIIRQLLRIGPQTIPRLTRALTGECPESRKVAAEVLGNFGEIAVPSLIEGIYHQDFWIRKASAQALEKMGQPIVPSLIEVICQDCIHDEQNARCTICQSASETSYTILKNLKGQSLAALICCLNGTNSQLSKFALKILRKISPQYQDAIPELLYLVNHEKPFIRQASLWSLRKIGSTAPEILQVIKSAMEDENADVRSAATEALQELQEKG